MEAKPRPICMAIIWPATTNSWTRGRQERKAHAHADEDLLQGDHHRIGTQGFHLGHGRDHGHDQDGHE